MLIRFVVSNYLSFGAETEFNMVTGSPRRMKEHIYNYGELELLKTAAIYGANGAGKSNLLKAIQLLKNIVKTGSWDAVSDFQPFRLDEKYKTAPVCFEIEFIKEGKSYSYGIRFSRTRVEEEWLCHTCLGKRDELIFNRTNGPGEKTSIKVDEKYLNSPEDKLRIKLYEEELLQDREVLIKKFAEAKQVFEEIRLVYAWFKDDLTIIFPRSKPFELILNYSKSDKFRKFTLDWIAAAQTGIESLDLEVMDFETYFGEDDKEQANILKNRLPPGRTYAKIHSRTNDAIAVREAEKFLIKKLVANHRNEEGKLINFNLNEESDGTQRILDLIPAIFQVYDNAATVLVDELDQSIHPFLLKDVIAKFAEDTSTKGQFIFTTHESNLLDQEIFRQDEIWFAEKKSTGETTLYPLSDFEIRNDLDIRKGYLNGRFGAIPFLGNLKDLNWEKYAETEPGV